MNVLGLCRAAIVMIVLDIVWIRTVLMSRYASMGRKIQGGREMAMRPLPGAIAYALMIVGLSAFVIPPSGRRGWRTTVRRGATFGIVVHGVYNATNMSLFADWDASIAFMDVLWAAGLYAAAGLAYG